MTADTDPPATRPRRGTMLMLATVAVAAFGLALAIVLVDNARGGHVRERTLPAVALMALGSVGPFVAGLAVRRWWHRATGRAGSATTGLWLAAWLVAAATFAASPGGAWEPVVPFTPTFTIQCRPDGQPSFQVRGAFGGGEELRGERRTNGLLTDVITVAYRVHPDAAGVRAIEFEGSASPPGRRPLEVVGTLTLAERAWLRVEGLAGAALLLDDRPTEVPVRLEPGSYQIVVRGAPGS